MWEFEKSAAVYWLLRIEARRCRALLILDSLPHGFFPGRRLNLEPVSSSAAGVLRIDLLRNHSF